MAPHETGFDDVRTMLSEIWDNPSQERRRSILWLVDHTGQALLTTMVNQLQRDEISPMVDISSWTDESSLERIVSQKKMGTRAVVLAKYERARWVEEVLLKLGIAGSDIFVRALADKTQLKVYCAPCANSFSTERHQPVTCPYCGTNLAVSEHFSKRLNSFLGWEDI